MKNCLIVDDSGVIRKLIKQMLEKYNLQISEAENGQIALDLCKATNFDFIMLDWNMPVMTGIDFLKNFRLDTKNSATKVIFCTTENDLTKIEAALIAGADEYIMKPFSADILHDKLVQTGLIT